MNMGFKKVYQKPILDTSAVNWPVGLHEEIMFPTVIEMGRYLDNALDRFYLYYATHTGNGIGLATAPRPEGPFRPYRNNPVLHLKQAPGFRGHISSPEVIWCKGKEQLYLYFHGSCSGDHQTEGLAISKDGLEFEAHKENPLFLVGGCDWDADTAAYLRVFRRDSFWYGIYMGVAFPVPQSQGNALGVARSLDGILVLR